jgi:hypothetical protein
MRCFRGLSATRLAVMLLVGLLFTAERAAIAAEGGKDLQKGAGVAIVVTAANLPAPATMAVDDLVQYLQSSLQVSAKTYRPTTSISALDENACIIVGASENADFPALIRQTGVQVATDDLGDEGGLIKSAVVGTKPIVLLVGKTWTGTCHAVYSFLEQELGVGFFIDGDHVPKLDKLTLSGIDRKEIPRVGIRGLFYHPTWPHPHANCCRLWSFDKWKQYIDWMRHRRINVLPLFHDDGGYSWGDVIFKAFPKLEKNDKTLAHFITDPTWRTGINHQIIDYARQSGVKIAYNLFYSQVPQFFADYYPELEYHPLRMRNVGIKYTQPECKQIMKKYWQTILDTYGVDDSHLYIICSYKHELPLPNYVDSRNEPTRHTIEVLREIDPAAKIFVETWCWKYLHESPQPKPRFQWLNENAPIEWKRFDAEIPKDIGVADWDTKKDPERIPDPRFGERPYLQLTHTTMEGWWPPDTSLRHPQWVMDYFDTAIRDGADGILSFHINANTNPLLADLTAEIGLRQAKLPAYYRDYARRRFGRSAGDTMAESLEAFCDAVEMGKNSHISSKRTGFEDMALFYTFPGFRSSAEELLDRSRQLGDQRTAWISARLEALKPKAALAARAILLARSVAPELKDDVFYQEYLWQLDYLAARMDGIESLFRSYLVVDKNPAEAQRLFDRALLAFGSVKSLFRDSPRYHMAKLQELEPNVPFTKSFLSDWEFRGSLDTNTYAFHVVYERTPKFEEFMRSLLPPELGNSQRSSLDVRPFFEVLQQSR